MSLYGLTGGAAGKVKVVWVSISGWGVSWWCWLIWVSFYFSFGEARPTLPIFFFFQQAVGQLSVWQGGSWVSLMVDRTG